MEALGMLVKSPAPSSRRPSEQSGGEKKTELTSDEICSYFTRDLKGEDAAGTLRASVADEELHLMMVSDGHGGTATSQHLKEHLLQRIVTEAKDGSSDSLKAACSVSFAQLHAEVRALLDPKEEGQENTSGATCTVVIFNMSRRECTTANVGDSEALLVHGRANGATTGAIPLIKLTVTHRLQDSLDEQERCSAVSGCTIGLALKADGVTSGGPMRAFPGGLSVTRSIGDGDCGDIVSCEPSCKTVHVPAAGGVVAVCSNGVWDALSFDAVARQLHDRRFESATTAAHHLVHQALTKTGLLDDTTAAVLFFGAAPGTADGPDFVATHISRQDKGKNTQVTIGETSQVTAADQAPMQAPAAAPARTSLFSWISGRAAPARKESMDGSTHTVTEDDFSRSRYGPPLMVKDPTLTPVPRMAGDSSVKGGTCGRMIREDHFNRSRYPKSSTSDPASDGGDDTQRRSSFADMMAPRTKNSSALEEHEMDLWLGRADTRVLEPEYASQAVHSKMLGEGEFAQAFETTLDGRSVVLKILRNEKRVDDHAIKGLKREILILTTLQHPNVLRAIALGASEDGVPFMVVERLYGMLSKMLPRDPAVHPFWITWADAKKWPLTRSINYGLQLARALEFCHEHAVPGYRVLHRDIKPSNIGFTAPAEGQSEGQLVLFDFGLVHLWPRRHPEGFVDQSDSFKKATGSHGPADEDTDKVRDLTGECGSLRYMSPEVANSLPVRTSRTACYGHGHKAPRRRPPLLLLLPVCPSCLCYAWMILLLCEHTCPLPPHNPPASTTIDQRYTASRRCSGRCVPGRSHSAVSVR